MRKQSVWKHSRFIILALAIAVFGGAGTVMAETSSSNNYQATDMEFGSGSSDQSCSSQYCAQTSIGDMVNGDASNPTTGTAQFGAIDGTEPLLELIIEPGQSNLGVLTTETTATKTTIIKIRNYLSDGYILQINGDTPVYNGHNLASPSEPSDSVAGQEQFGMNVVANTNPSVGADPSQMPDATMSFGIAANNYNIANKFMYRSGDVIAKSEKSSGQTDYTVSMIVNISNVTPAGHYSGDFSAIVVPVY